MQKLNESRVRIGIVESFDPETCVGFIKEGPTTWIFDAESLLVAPIASGDTVKFRRDIYVGEHNAALDVKVLRRLA